MSHADRRAACRYLVPAQARLWWEGSAGVHASVSNVSATGCRLEGETMPRMGERLWVSLAVPGLPDLRLPARAVRESASPAGMPRAAVRFDVPSDRVSGLELLLLQRLEEEDGQGVVLIIEPDARTRERLVKTVRRSGQRSIAVARTDDALRMLNWLRIDTLLARAHPEGVLALLTVGARVPHARRALIGGGEAVHTLQARGDVDVILDELASAPGLHKAIDWSAQAKRA
jgi:hypothetical protein